MTTQWFERTRELAVAMTRFYSLTDQAGERDFGPFLLGILRRWAYFQKHSEQVWLERTVGDPLVRDVVMALVKGRGSRTVILTGHYDVVGIENYGDLAGWACSPDELLPRLISKLQEVERRRGLSPDDLLALEDLRGGDFLPGRGLLDMKSGLAAGLAVLEHFSQIPEGERGGNLLFVGVPDEEIASHGVRTAALRLPDIARLHGLSLVGAINLDASNDPGSAREGQAAYLGSVGKLLPAVYLVGRETHAGSPFSGVNAALLAAELTRRVECNPGLVDQCEGQFTPPPVCLKMGDTKTHYNVTTPTAVWCYYNWQVFSQPAGAILERVMGLAREALEAGLERLRGAAERYARDTGQSMPPCGWEGRVYSFADVKRLALDRGGEPVHRRLEALEAELARDASLDAPQMAQKLTEVAWMESGLSGPAAVVGFAAIYYPPVHIGDEDVKGKHFKEVIARQVEAVSRERGTPVRVRPFFPGISDISFLSGRPDKNEIDTLAANSPVWTWRTGFDYSVSAGLDLPAANIGPWGRDYHQRTERVYMPYSFEILPELVWRVCEELKE